MMEKSPQKKTQASGSLKEPGSVRRGSFRIDGIEPVQTKTVATAGRVILKNVFLFALLTRCCYRKPLNFWEAARIKCHSVWLCMRWEMLLSDTSQKEIGICLGFGCLRAVH